MMLNAHAFPQLRAEKSDFQVCYSPKYNGDTTLHISDVSTLDPKKLKFKDESLTDKIFCDFVKDEYLNLHPLLTGNDRQQPCKLLVNVPG